MKFWVINKNLALVDYISVPKFDSQTSKAMNILFSAENTYFFEEHRAKNGSCKKVAFGAKKFTHGFQLDDFRLNSRYL